MIVILKLGFTDIAFVNFATSNSLRNLLFYSAYQDVVNMSSLFVVVQFRGMSPVLPRSVDKNNDQS